MPLQIIMWSGIAVLLVCFIGNSAVVAAGGGNIWTRFSPAVLNKSSGLMDERLVDNVKIEVNCALSVNLE